MSGIEQDPSEQPLEQNEPLSTAALAGAQPVSPEAPSREPRSFDPAQPLAEPDTARDTPLFSPEEVSDLRGKWDMVQAGFVDEPRKAVEQADTLVAQTMKRLAEMFAAERSNLEGQWDRGDQVSTEDLRVAFRRYRSFFDRLLSV